ncbi:hypothetical protein BJX76DRAFT_361484 [Aspergillus varians]
MKASFAALALSLVGATFAAPAAQSIKRQGNRHYNIGTISLRHLIEENAYVFISHVTNYNEDGSPHIGTTCQTRWNPSAPAGPENPQACAFSEFTFWFPSGVSDLENYEVAVAGPEGQGTVEIVAGPRYECGPYDGTIANIDYECHTTESSGFTIPLS